MLIREIIIISLIVSLVTKELTGLIDSKLCHRLSTFLTFPIICLLILFLIIILKVVDNQAVSWWAF